MTELQKFKEASKIEECSQIFKKLPTYRPGIAGGSIRVGDIPEMCKNMGYIKSPAEMTTIVNYLDDKNNGILTYDEYTGILKVFDDPSAVARILTTGADLDGDGFISAEEFHQLIPCLVIHDKRLAGFGFQDFLREADTNKDGKISIDEGAEWIRKILNKR